MQVNDTRRRFEAGRREAMGSKSEYTEQNETRNQNWNSVR
jgi:hypothetical protein